MLGRRVAGALRSLVAAGVSLATAAAPAATFTFRHDAVLGTALELVVEARDAEAAGAAERAVLAEIDRLAAVASTYAPDAEISRWLAAGVPARVSADLTAILRACDAWRERSGGVFHPGAALAVEAWKQAERDGTQPADGDLAAIALRLGGPPWEWHGREVVPTGMPVSVDALAKGYIVDSACARALDTDGVDGAMVNVGGDLAVRGRLERAVSIPLALPGGTVHEIVRVADRALATSGGGRRGFRIDGRLLSHVIDPRSARPATAARSASVIAASAADADALATILCVLAPRDAVALVERSPGAACLIVDGAGGVHASRGWPARRTRTVTVSTRQAPAAREPWNGGFELALDLSIVRAEGGRRYRRPYVAAWIEDADGFPVKTLLLWVQAEAPGPRWIPDLKRWAKADRLRRLAEDGDLVATISEPTRMPGSHGVVWDGRDNAGNLLEAGDYTVCVEAAREHGTYQFERAKVTFGREPFTVTMPPNDELGGVTLDYRRTGDDER